ncbi:T9SS type A sorting domain-containing protein [bacterium]|nr:T9SS type A sorting domain-containing protein [bacterium]
MNVTRTLKAQIDKFFLLLLFTILFLPISNLCALPESKINASDLQASDYFGTSVSIDGNYAIVGAFLEAPGGVSSAGSAYIFYRSDNSWTQQAKINASDPQADDYFGISVSINGDYAIVGAYYEDPGDINRAGSAYIFHRSGEDWTQQAKINASDAEEEDNFGAFVSISGDYAIVGAYLEDPGGVSAAGSAYIFHRSGEDWTQQAKINASDAQESDRFGYSVSINGDYIIVGAYGDDPGGSAYIFHRSGEDWTQQAKINASDAQESDRFGYSVSINGDYVIVGASEEHPGDVSNAGSAYIFHRSGEDWTQQAKINASDLGQDDRFGTSVSISSDYVIVGAPEEDPGNVSMAGSAYIFHRSGESWTEQMKITASDVGENDAFGRSVSISDNYLAAGAMSEDPGGIGNAGSAYIYKHRTDKSIPRSKYALIGIPGTVDDGDANGLFQDDFGGAAPGHPRWRVSRWNDPDQWYERYNEGEHQNIADFAPGLGFWVVQAVVDNCVLDIEADHLTDFVAEDARFEVPLSPGRSPRSYTQVANPFSYAYDLANTYFSINGGAAITVGEATGGGYINGNAATWDADNEQYNYIAWDEIIDPWTGFWVIQTDHTVDIDILFTPDGFVAEAPPRPEDDQGQARDDYDDWALELPVKSVDEEYRDVYNKAGIKASAVECYDAYDAFEFTPMNDEYVHLYFPHQDWDFQPASYSYDYRSPDFDGAKVWEFTVKVVNLPNREFVLRWDNIGDIHYHYFFRLEDADGNRICDMRETEEFTFRSGDANNQELNYRLVVEYHPEGVEGETAGVPLEFGIVSAYPNPFNSEISIGFNLISDGKTSLRVFDLQGREVAVIGQSELSAGAHQLMWDASGFGSGVYIVRLEAEGEVSARKVVLLR